ncbi:MAG TPA: condensation domain-containing protein, partial [Phytomonospora sp.]
REALAGAPAELAHPTDRPRSALTGTAGDEYTFALSDLLVGRLGALAAARGTTVHPILSAGYALLTAALTGEHDIVLAGPYAQRERRELEPLVGFFASLMPIRVDVSADIGFADLVGRVHEGFLEGLAHQPAPFPRILGAVDPEWVYGAPAPLATTLLVVNPPVPELPLPGLRTRVVDLALETARRDFAFQVAPAAGSITGAVEYSTDLYDHDTIVAWCDAYIAVLDRAAADPSTPVPVLLGSLREALGRND